MIRHKNSMKNTFIRLIFILLFLFLVLPCATSFAQEWAQTVGTVEDDTAKYADTSFYQSTSDGYIVSGDTGILKLDMDGNILWQKSME